ncbi:hypothetical protein C6Y14_40680 [Streptomyces dioscori]|uniref:SUKH-3 domain containing protein n=1 Tax=Streptomyces dioscori TaxID=2109333 RepID=A0A2P8PUV3_9ACTN|nr:SUKH-3 domain-containing protein [Streptomyces dioscori]PSM37785.1 hypothetical protein C6Y14_40680 [Streptomyces dioscori]
MMARFSPGTEQRLRDAGWVPDRRVDLTRWRASLSEFTWHEAAEKFLREFGGIRVELDGPGVTRALEPFELDPELAVGEAGRFAELSERFGRHFFPVGEVGQGEFFLAIDEEGVVHLLAAWVLRCGPSDLALERLITGVAPERLVPVDGSPP